MICSSCFATLNLQYMMLLDSGRYNRSVVCCSVVLLFVLCTSSLLAQHEHCSLEHYHPSYRNYMIQTAGEAARYDQHLLRTEPRDVSLNIIIVNYNEGPLVTPQFVQQHVDAANEVFAEINLHFSICNIQYVDYPYEMSYIPGFAMWSQEIQDHLMNEAWLPGYLNIFYGSGAGPMAGLPGIWGWDAVLMNAGPSYVFIHELAHYFSLWHTHAFNGYSTNIYTLELVDGSNCDTEGDFVCDTPADPGLYGRISPAPSCDYIDNVSVDANGDLYQPLTDNYMCATNPNCITSFTPLQLNRMAYCLDHERAYLKSGGNGLVVEEAPRLACISDEPIVLQGSDPEGVFSGNGVVDGVFYPELAGVGHHVITYTGNTSAEIVETTDAYYTYHDTTYIQTTSWQSFLATTSGTFSAFSFLMKHSSDQEINYSIIEGNDDSGNLLLQGVSNAMTNDDFDWMKIIFETPLVITAGNYYTLKIEGTSVYEVAGMKSNVYQPGQSNMAFDFSFISYVIPTELNCGNTTLIEITVGDYTQITPVDILPVYCASAPTSEISFLPNGGMITVDGVVDSVVNPTALGSGLHLAEYAYENIFGCGNTSQFEIHVGPTAQTGIANDLLICSGDSLLELNLSPNDGLLWLDDILVSELPIQLNGLSLGEHELKYITPGEYPWHTTMDQSWSPSNPFWAWGLNDYDTLWQSFTASVDGYLDLFRLGFYSNDIVEVNYQLYKGNGVDGQLLFSGETEFGAQSTYIQDFDIPDFTYLLDADSVYTVAVIFEQSFNTTINADYVNSYAGGTSSYAYPGMDIDFRFEEYIHPLIECGADTSITSFTIGEAFEFSLGDDLLSMDGAPVTISSNVLASNYLWSTGESTQQIEYSPEEDTTYVWLTVTNEYGCSDTDTISVYIITGVDELMGSDWIINVYPNPVTDELHFSSNAATCGIEITDMSGQLVYSNVLRRNANQKDKLYIGHLESGYYHLCIHTEWGYKVIPVLKME